MKNVFQQWVERAQYDLSSARAMLDARKYLYVAFMCQQAVEKVLKAVLVKKGERVPFIHNLRKIASVAGLDEELTSEWIDLLERLTPFAIKARYGSYKEKLSELCDRRTATNFVQSTENFIKWLEKKM